MTNKILIVILVLLVVIAGGAGYYSYSLQQQVDHLDARLTTFEADQAARTEALGSELASLRADTREGINFLKEQVAGIKTDIGGLETGLGDAETRISGVEEATGAMESQIDKLDERISQAESDISRAMVDASVVSEQVSRATVRITNGGYTAGSGFIYDNDGHVLTAYHVVESLTPIYVMLDDGRIFPASVAGYCQYSDVAVLSLESNPDVTPVITGNSSLMRVGEPVIAIGSPESSLNSLGLKDTLTAGILSKVNLFLTYGDSQGKLELTVANLLQFDAAVNFGNSGGPLANSRGEVIGLVTARIDPTLGDGINWAVSSNKFKRVAEAIISSGSFDYPWIGTGIADLTPDMVENMSLETANGVLVTAVFTDSPAEMAGIKTNDIIIAIDGVPVNDSGELTSYLGEYKSPGDNMTLDIIRGVSELRLSVIVGERQP
jgi:S1-C subfamily serine protease